MAERILRANGVEICTEAFGDASDPAVLLVMGLAGSMVWWDERFCALLAGRGLYVIRYDHRDTGRSVTYDPGRPGYSGADLVADAAAVLDGHGIPAAHVVGLSAGGALAQVLATDHPERVRSLVLISTSFALGDDRAPLPGPSEELAGFFETPPPDATDRKAIAEDLVAYQRVLAGGRRPFDERHARDVVRIDIARARNHASARNHELIEGAAPSRPLSAITAPTLVIHGTADPIFPPEHGEALAGAIPGARLTLLDGAGHGIEPADRETLAGAIADHIAEG
jgi:pimeloyl-ACP methyl ester carboxylesterase